MTSSTRFLELLAGHGEPSAQPARTLTKVTANWREREGGHEKEEYHV